MDWVNVKQMSFNFQKILKDSLCWRIDNRLSFLTISQPRFWQKNGVDCTLNWDKKLKQVRVQGPGLGAFAAPCAQEADTDLPVLVQIRVQAVWTVRVVVYNRRGLNKNVGLQ